MPKKKSKPEAPNGSAVQSVEPSVSAGPLHGPPLIDESLVRARDLKRQMEKEVRAFRDNMVAKYRSYEGRDLRKDLSLYMEQMGISISNEMEQAKREERLRARENQDAK